MDDSNPDLSDDLTQRYGSQLSLLSSLVDNTARRAEREQEVAQSISTPGSLAQYLVDLPRREAELQSLISAGKTAEAKEMYDGIYAVIDANRQGLSAVGVMDPRAGANTKMLVDQANRALSYGFNKLPVTTVDGQETTLQQFFADPNMYKNPGKSYEDRGFYRSDVDAFLNSDDEGLRRSLGFFMKSKGPLHLQDKDAAHAVRTNWGDITDVFGKGAEAMVQNLYATHRDSGAPVPMLKAMIELGRAHSQATGLKDEELTSSFFGAYRDLIFSAYRGDSDQTGTQARDITPNKRLQADALITRTLAEMARQNQMYSRRLDDPILREGLRSSVSMIAEAAADGIDLVKEAAQSGTNLYAVLASDMADRVSGLSTDNIPARWRRFNDGLRNQFSGGRDFAQMQFDLSGDARDYLKLARSAGGRSTNQAADGISAAIMTRLRRAFAGDVFGGKTPAAAWDALRADPDRMRAAMDDMAGDLAKYFTGPGARPLATLMASRAYDAFGRGMRFNAETVLRDLAVDSKFSKSNPLAYSSARDWYYGNVAATMRYADKLADLDRHVASDEGGGLNDRDRAAFMSRMRSRVAEMSRAVERGDTTVDPARMIDEQLNRGKYYVQRPVEMRDKDGNIVYEKGKDGKPVIDPKTGQPKPKYMRDRNGNLVLNPDEAWSTNLRRDRGEATVDTVLAQQEIRRQYLAKRDLAKQEALDRQRSRIKKEEADGGDGQ